jgi:hypothetical protein
MTRQMLTKEYNNNIAEELYNIKVPFTIINIRLCIHYCSTNEYKSVTTGWLIVLLFPMLTLDLSLIRISCDPITYCYNLTGGTPRRNRIRWWRHWRNGNYTITCHDVKQWSIVSTGGTAHSSLMAVALTERLWHKRVRTLGSWCWSAL